MPAKVPIQMPRVSEEDGEGDEGENRRTRQRRGLVKRRYAAPIQGNTVITVPPKVIQWDMKPVIRLAI